MGTEPATDVSLEAVRGVPVATLYEANGRRGAVGPTVLPVAPGMHIAGPAATVRCPPGDARGLWEAVALAGRGTVIVLDVGSRPTTALGSGTVKAALARGVGGIVTNGAVRDVAELRALGMPVFACGVDARGTTKVHPGTRGATVRLGEAECEEGGLVFGDDDGVLFVAPADRAALLRAVPERCRLEAAVDRRLAAGEDPRDVLGLR